MTSKENNMKLKDSDIERMSKEEMIQRIKQLDAHVYNLRNVIAKQNTPDTNRKLKKHRPFDFSKYNVRHVALKVAYLGWDYQGYAVQEDNNQTIEANIFEALLTTRLIESRVTSNYHRCGRTDKGVSAFSQVITLDLRTNLKEGKGVIKRESAQVLEVENKEETQKKEIPYCLLLNKVLPPDIRMLGWCPVEPDFSARFNCLKRTYKYYFPKAGLDIQKMRCAAAKLVGSHDFRNFCKMDVANGVTTFTRHILHADVTPISQRSKKTPNFDSTRTQQDPFVISEIPSTCPKEYTKEVVDHHISPEDCHRKQQDSPAISEEDSQIYPEDSSMKLEEADHAAALVDPSVAPSENPYSMYALTIKGNAFLYHQIRCIVAVLFMIGNCNETPEVIDSLLDVTQRPRKPQYLMASELPLVLFDSEFEDLDWSIDAECYIQLQKTVQELWTKHTVKASMCQFLLEKVASTAVTDEASVSQPWDAHEKPVVGLLSPLDLDGKTSSHRSLLNRITAESLEDRIQHFEMKKRKRVNPTEQESKKQST